MNFMTPHAVKSTIMALVTKSAAWWQEQAATVTPAPCPKCGAETHGAYVLDHDEGWTYRAVIERCPICGWSHVCLSQQQSGPIIPGHPRGMKPVGASGVKEPPGWKKVYNLTRKPRMSGAQYRKRARERALRSDPV